MKKWNGSTASLEALAVALLAMLALPAADLHAQEWRLSVESGIETSTLLDFQGNVWNSPLDTVLFLEPQLRYGADLFEFTTQARFAVAPEMEQPELSLNGLNVTVYPTGWLVIRAGRFQYLPGAAQTFSPNNFFHMTDYEELLSGSGTQALIPRDMVQVSTFVDRYFFTATLAPRPAPYPLPDPSSPWFPAADLPEQLTFVFPTDKRLERGTVYVEPVEIPRSLSNVSVSAEIGGSFRWFDLSAFYFHGQNNTPAIQTELDFPQGIFEFFDVYLHPQVTTVDTVGLSGTGVFDRFRLILDATYSFNEIFNTERLSVQNFTTELGESPWLEATFGGSYRLANPSLLLSVEYHRGFAFNDVERIVTPVLSSVLIADLRASFFDTVLEPNLTALISFVDYSWALVPTVTYNPTQQLALSLRAPQFFGAAGSELGQFRENHLISLALTWRF